MTPEDQQGEPKPQRGNNAVPAWPSPAAEKYGTRPKLADLQALRAHLPNMYRGLPLIGGWGKGILSVPPASLRPPELRTPMTLATLREENRHSYLEDAEGEGWGAYKRAEWEPQGYCRSRRGPSKLH